MRKWVKRVLVWCVAAGLMAAMAPMLLEVAQMSDARASFGSSLWGASGSCWGSASCWGPSQGWGSTSCWDSSQDWQSSQGWESSQGRGVKSSGGKWTAFLKRSAAKDSDSPKDSGSAAALADGEPADGAGKTEQKGQDPVKTDEQSAGQAAEALSGERADRRDPEASFERMIPLFGGSLLAKGRAVNDYFTAERTVSDVVVDRFVRAMRQWDEGSVDYETYRTAADRLFANHSDLKGYLTALRRYDPDEDRVALGDRQSVALADSEDLTPGESGMKLRYYSYTADGDRCVINAGWVNERVSAADTVQPVQVTVKDNGDGSWQIQSYLESRYALSLTRRGESASGLTGLPELLFAGEKAGVRLQVTRDDGILGRKGWSVRWKSSDPAVVSVSDRGDLETGAAGDAVLTAAVSVKDSGGKPVRIGAKSWTVTVTPDRLSVRGDPERSQNIRCAAGEKVRITPRLYRKRGKWWSKQSMSGVRYQWTVSGVSGASCALSEDGSALTVEQMPQGAAFFEVTAKQGDQLLAKARFRVDAEQKE